MTDDNDELRRELRRRLDAQAEQREAMLTELRQLQAGSDHGHGAMNDALRGVRGSPMPDGPEGPKSMNDALRAAAGRPPLDGKGRQ